VAVYWLGKPMNYVAQVTRSSTGWLVEFPDVPRCSAMGESQSVALARAKEALARWMRQHLALAQAPPRRYAGPGHVVELPGDISLAIDLRDARCSVPLTRAELAQRAGVPTRLIEDLETALTVPMLGKVIPIANALGMRPVVELERLGEATGLTRGTPRAKPSRTRAPTR
jgi:predicted RNase H-like HicB family nuclease